VVLEENGLITVTGGKLTTFRRMARDTVSMARSVWSELPLPAEENRVFAPLPEDVAGTPALDNRARRRLLGRYGADTAAVLAAAAPGELEVIPGTDTCWAELRWAARQEAVVHLEDLMLRRVRLGLVLPEGGVPILGRVRSIVQPELGWDDARWDLEAERYARVWRTSYSLPASAGQECAAGS
jgi:glycerol-3-phosphate dehydrogenase